MHQDNDFTTHITSIFFKAIKLIIQQISSLAWVCIRKAKLKGTKLLAKQVRDSSSLERILRSPIGFRLLKSVRTSPDYLENTRKNIFAMIRKLGPPTFFVTLMSAEHFWQPLIQALQQMPHKQSQKHIETIEDINLDFQI